MEFVSSDMSDFLEKIDLNKILRYVLLMFLTLMAQNMVFSHIRPFGVCPLLLPAMAAAVGMFEGATWGPLLSMAMGYFADMSFVEHRVFFLLVLPAVSMLSAFLSQFFINRRCRRRQQHGLDAEWPYMAEHHVLRHQTKKHE